MTTKRLGKKVDNIILDAVYDGTQVTPWDAMELAKIVLKASNKVTTLLTKHYESKKFHD